MGSIRISQICKLYMYCEDNPEVKVKNIIPPFSKVSKSGIKRFINLCTTDLDQINLTYISDIWSPSDHSSIPEDKIIQIIGVVARNQIIAQTMDKLNPIDFFHQNVFEKDELNMAGNFNIMVDKLTNEEAKAGPSYQPPSYFVKMFDTKIEMSTTHAKAAEAKMTSMSSASELPRSRSSSLKRLRADKAGEEEKLRKQAENDQKKKELEQQKKLAKLSSSGTIDPDFMTLLTNALTSVTRMESKIEGIDTKLAEINKFKEDLDQNKTNIDKCQTQVNNHKTRIEQNERRLDELEAGVGVGGADGSKASNDLAEYFTYLDRQASSRTSSFNLSRRLDFLIPVDMIRQFEANERHVALNDKCDTFEISARKILLFLNARFTTRMEWLAVYGEPRWRNLKLAVVIQFTSPFLAKTAIDKRIQLKINEDSKKNCSLSRVINGAHQKCHSLLTEMKKTNRIQELFISKAGFVNYTIKDPNDETKSLIRTVLDPLEVLYFYNKGEEVDSDILTALIKNEYFINSKLSLTETPKRFRPKEEPVGMMY